MMISVIIPTRNRPQEVKNVLVSLAKQTRLPDEVILVDASDDISYTMNLKDFVKVFPLHILSAEPSVCIQRNTGIRAAKGEWIFLCDDDIVPEPNYLHILENYIIQTNCGAVCGILLQREDDQWVDQYPVSTLGELLYRFIFQLSLWGSIEGVKSPFFLTGIKNYLIKYYRRRGNTISYAGWPVITDWSQPFFQTKVFSLGANLVKKDWLLNSPFDETLDPSGIGDNFGVILGFPGNDSIHIIHTTKAKHDRSGLNRIDHALAYYRRALALHYFIKRNPGIASVPFFVWSLLGNLILSIFKGKTSMAFASFKVITLVITNQNPYWQGFRSGSKKVSPEL